MLKLPLFYFDCPYSQVCCNQSFCSLSIRTASDRRAIPVRNKYSSFARSGSAYSCNLYAWAALPSVLIPAPGVALPLQESQGFRSHGTNIGQGCIWRRVWGRRSTSSSIARSCTYRALSLRQQARKTSTGRRVRFSTGVQAVFEKLCLWMPF